MDKDKTKEIVNEENEQRGYVGRKLAETIELSFESFELFVRL